MHCDYVACWVCLLQHHPPKSGAASAWRHWWRVGFNLGRSVGNPLGDPTTICASWDMPGNQRQCTSSCTTCLSACHPSPQIAHYSLHYPPSLQVWCSVQQRLQPAQNFWVYSEFLSFFVLYSRLLADFLSHLGKWVKLIKFEAENEFLQCSCH